MLLHNKMLQILNNCDFNLIEITTNKIQVLIFLSIIKMYQSTTENYDIYNQYKKEYIKYLLVINLFFFCILYILSYNKSNNFSPYKPNIEKIIIGNGSYAKIGIISDIHLSQSLKQKNIQIFQHYSNNIRIALKYFRENSVDVLIFAGDITNDGSLINLFYFKKILHSIYNGFSKPKCIFIMGNHDFYNFKSTPEEIQKNFYKITNSYPNSHYIINNYHFIFLSQNNSENSINYTWVKNNINIAKRNLNKKGDPIFMITHIPPKNTIYGSESFLGHKDLYNFLKNYNEVICISGHTHRSLKNIKSIWHGNFTAVNTQSISFISIDKYFANEKEVIFESGKNTDSMGLIAHLNDKNIIFERIQFYNGEIMEEKWKIDFPINNKNFGCITKKNYKKIIPNFSNDTIKLEEIKKNNSYGKYIVFNAAQHQDYVYKYKIILEYKKNYSQKIFYYYSDYYTNTKFRKKIIKYKLPDYIISGIYNIKIYAIDSFNSISYPIKKRIKI